MTETVPHGAGAPDRRTTFANRHVAHVSLRGVVDAPRFAEGAASRVIVPIADLLAEPDGSRNRQVQFGARVQVLDTRDGFAFVQAAQDGYVGYLPAAAIGADRVATHRVCAPATHLYGAPRVQAPTVAALSMSAALCVVGTSGKFAETADGDFVPRVHLCPLEHREADPVAVAERFLGTPYLWGGNSHAGIDCSGLVQLALWACGKACPGDSDQQAVAIGSALPASASYQRGDLLFWRGHVAMVVDAERIIHANGHAMAVSYEGTRDAIARIDAQGEGPLLCARRP